MTIIKEGEGGSRNSPILHANHFESRYNIAYDNMLGKVNNRQTYPINHDNKKEVGEGGSRNSPISMQMMQLMNIIYNNTTTYNGLIIGKLTRLLIRLFMS